MRRVPFGPIAPGRRKERGIAMFVVTIIIAVLTLGAAALLGLMKIERRTTAKRLGELKTVSANQSGATLLRVLAGLSDKERQRLGGVYDNPRLFRAVPVVPEQSEGGLESGEPRFTFLAPKFTRDTVEGLRYGIVNESSRLNLSSVLAWELESPGSGRAALMALPGMTDVMADSILDWIDPDERTRPHGAEASYYAGKRLPYSPRNAVPVFLEEILLARDVTRYQLYGTDEAYCFGLKADGRPAAAPQGEVIGSLRSVPGEKTDEKNRADPLPWSELLTVYSAERDVDPEGQPRVDLNGSDLRFLHDELAAYTNDEIAAFVTLYRQYGPADKSAGGQTKKATAEILDYSIPPTASLGTPLDIVGAKVFVPSADDPAAGTLYRSPIDDRRSAADSLFAYLDYVSTARSTVITGRVNVNLAPRPVLAAIPGMTSTMIDRIIGARPAMDRPVEKNFRHAAWIYAQGLVDLETMKKIWDKVTAGGDVWSTQVVGYLAGTRMVRRSEVVADGTVSPARQVFYKDLSMYGLGFSMSVITGAASSEPSTEDVLSNLLPQGDFSDQEVEFPQDDAGEAPMQGDPFQVIEAGQFR